MKKLFFLLFLVTFFNLSLKKVWALETNRSSFEISPAFLEATISDQQQISENNITLTNNTQSALEVEVFLTEFTQTGHFGMINFVSNLEGNYLKNTTSFISINKDRLVIDPKTAEKIIVRVENRPSLSPGGHYFALIARVINNNDDHSTQKVSPALSSLFLIRKEGGEMTNLSLKSLDWDPGRLTFKIPQRIELLFINEGNVHVVPRGSVVLRDIFGNQIFQGIINEESSYILPGTQRKIPVRIKSSSSIFPLLFITMEVQGYAAGSDYKFLFESSFFYINQFLFLTIIIVPIILILARIFLKKGKFRVKKKENVSKLKKN